MVTGAALRMREGAATRARAPVLSQTASVHYDRKIATGRHCGMAHCHATPDADTMMLSPLSTRSTLAKSVTLAATAIAILAILAVLATAPTARAADASAPTGPTREEVRKDLEAWERAGLRDTYRGDGGPPFFDPDVQRRLAEYQRLRAGAASQPSPPPPPPPPQ